MADSSNSTLMPSASNVVTHPREQLRQLRSKMAQAVDMLISAIDAIDGDPDFEPSLASNVASASLGYLFPERILKADSALDELELDPSDLERSLGSVSCADQREWAQGDDGDYEEECDDEGHDSDTEQNGDEGDHSYGADDEVISGRCRESLAPVLDIKWLDMDEAGNVSFLKEGVPWVGGKLRPNIEFGGDQSANE